MRVRALSSLLVMCLALAGTAAADQITMGSSTYLGVTSNASFTGAGADSIAFSATCDGNADCLSGYAYLDNAVGKYDFWIVNGDAQKFANNGQPELGAPTGDIFPIIANGATFHLQFSFGSDVLAGIVTMQSVTDGTHVPRVIADLLIDTATGPTFSGWKPGTTVSMDFIVNLLGTYTVDDVWTGNAASTQGPISSGEVTTTPEPSSLTLLGSGVLAFAGALRLRIRF